MSEENLMILYYSGNKKLYEFMANEFPGLQKMNFEQKYKTKAMEYYRQLIKSQAMDLREPIKPNKRGISPNNIALIKNVFLILLGSIL